MNPASSQVSSDVFDQSRKVRRKQQTEGQQRHSKTLRDDKVLLPRFTTFLAQKVGSQKKRTTPLDCGAASILALKSWRSWNMICMHTIQRKYNYSVTEPDCAGETKNTFGKMALSHITLQSTSKVVSVVSGISLKEFNPGAGTIPCLRTTYCS